VLIDTATAVRLAASRTPDRAAIVEEDQQLTYAQLVGEINAIAGGLRRAGIADGDRVVLATANSLQATVALLAVQAAGAVAVPVNFRARAATLRGVLDAVGAAALVVDEHTTGAVDLQATGTCRELLVALDGPAATGALSLDQLRGSDRDGSADLDFDPRRPPIDGERAALVLLTSGSTGRPKLIPLTHRQSLARVFGLYMNHGFRQDDDMRCLGIMPIYHTVGLHAVLLLALLTNGTYYPVPTFVPEAVLELIRRERISYVFAAPTMFARLLDGARSAPEDSLASVRDAMYAGAPMDPTLVRRVAAEVTTNLTHIYGNTETYNSLFYRQAGDCPGALRPGILHRVRIVTIGGGHRDQVPPGTEGELIVDTASPEAFDGYADPVQTAERVHAGWYHTGDVALADEEGRIFIRGRADDMIITGGENVYPADVENVLLGHPGVAECAVVGVPDPTWGQQLVALIIAGERPPSAAELQEFCRHEPTLDPYKRPRRILLVDELPVNPNGKRPLPELRALALQAMARAAT
jgi:2-furoate---CoA ligase